MSEQLTTSQIRDLRDAAEKFKEAEFRYHSVVEVGEAEAANRNAWHNAREEFRSAADPTTVEALCTDLLRLKSYFDIFQERLNKGCSHCDFDEASGIILNYCDSCCRKLTAGVCDVLDKLQADSLTGDEG